MMAGRSLRLGRGLAFAAWVASLPAAPQTGGQLAVDKGCYACHGTPPKKNVPTLEKIAADYAKYRGQPEAVGKLAAKLREGHMFSSIKAHEQLTPESAAVLVRWLIDGGK